MACVARGFNRGAWRSLTSAFSVSHDWSTQGFDLKQSTNDRSVDYFIYLSLAKSIICRLLSPQESTQVQFWKWKGRLSFVFFKDVEFNFLEEGGLKILVQ